MNIPINDIKPSGSQSMALWHLNSVSMGKFCDMGDMGDPGPKEFLPGWVGSSSACGGGPKPSVASKAAVPCGAC